MNIGFIGNGRMCKSFAKYLENTDVNVVGVLTRSELYEKGGEKVDACALDTFIKKCEVVFLTVKDDGIRTLAQQIADTNINTEHCVFCHMSGSLCSDELAPLKHSHGIASFHTMTSLTGEFVDFSKVMCTLEGEGEGAAAVMEVAREAKLRYAVIKKEDKLLYHAASCICANYFVTLVGAAKDIYNNIGFDDADAYALMLPLIKQVVSNVENNGIENSLTGPVSRGDCGTLSKHMAEMLERMDTYFDLYRFMGSETVKFAERHKIADENSCNSMNKVFK